jgi:hypothetical protein
LSLKSAENGTTNFITEYGATPSFDFNSSNGWSISAVMYNGLNVSSSLASGVYTVPSITGNALLSVSFVANASTGTPQLVNSMVNVYTTQSGIIINGTSAGETVALYTVDGVLPQTILSVGEQLSLPVEKNAFYLVKTANKTFKVIL